MRKERVSGHYRYDPREGKKVKVDSFKRKAKPKKHEGIHRGWDEKIQTPHNKFIMKTWQDDQGRIVTRKIKVL